ncbi:MAG: hypothetical protein LBC64_08365 [Fibromonadaceae bacterium]|jgi:hypothetical protein|nr:hypothetical protein [Fibromonadaceae bacterium]
MPFLKTKKQLDIFEQFESEFSKKDLEEMKASAIDFFMKNIGALKQFIKKMQKDFGQNDLIFTLKMFVLNHNKVFNMVEYMKNQSGLAEGYVQSQGKDLNPEERRVALNQWIEKNAEVYRKRTVFKQIYCIDKMIAEIEPSIKKALKE